MNFIETYPSGQKETGAISSGIVGQTNLDTIARKFVTVGSGHDSVSLETSISNLTADILVGTPDNHAVLGGVVLVLVLHNKPLSSIKVSLTLATPAKLDLESLEVSFALDYLDERLQEDSICNEIPIVFQ